MTDVAEGRKGERRFCLVFALLTVAIFTVLYAAGDGVVSALNRHIAWTAAGALRGLGTSAAAAGAVVSAGGFAVEIKSNCNAIFEFGLYAAAVGAYPASLGAKAAGLLVGGGVLYAVNLARVVSLMALGLFAREWFEVSHLYVWQAFFFATVVTCWFGWILRLRPRAQAGLAGASLLWLVVGPAYAWGLAAVARAAAPVLEHSSGMRVEVVGTRVHVVRLFVLANERQSRELVYAVWAASGNFGLPLLAALVVATPGWGWSARARALRWGLGLLTVTQVAFLLVTFEFWQQMPVRDPRGGLLYLPGHSPLGLRLVTPLFYFFEIMGRGFFALLVYFALLVTIGGVERDASGVVRSRGPASRRRR